MRTQVRDHILAVMEEDEWLTGYAIRDRVIDHILESRRSTTFVTWLNKHHPSIAAWWLRNFSELSCSLYQPLHRLRNDALVAERWVGSGKRHIEYMITEQGLAVQHRLNEQLQADSVPNELPLAI